MVYVLVCEGNVSEFTFERSFYMFVSDVLFKSSKVTARLVKCAVVACNVPVLGVRAMIYCLQSAIVDSAEFHKLHMS